MVDIWSYARGGAARPDARGLDPAFEAALTSLYGAAPPEILSQGLYINSAFRSPERQAELYEAAIKKYGSPEAARKWVAPPGRSKHNSGSAVDLGYGSDGVKDWVHANLAAHGLHLPMAYEPWHVELAGSRGGNDIMTPGGSAQMAGLSMGSPDTDDAGLQDNAFRDRMDRAAYLFGLANELMG